MQWRSGFTEAAVAMALVGGAVTASTYLTGTALYGPQAVRYVATAILLVVVARRAPRARIVAPMRAEWWWLIAAATAGLSVYNLAVVAALEHAEPTAVATVVSGVPLVLAIGAPIVARRSFPIPLVGAAAVVVVGAGLVQGGGRSDLAGIALSLVALAGEAGFTLLSLPVLARVGAFSVATHTSWIAAAQLALLALITDGRNALSTPSRPVVAAIAYLVVASAVAFTLWFLAVGRVGGDVAGLAAGIIPVAAIVTGVPLGVATVDGGAVAGAALVVIGLVAGLRAAASTPSPVHVTASGGYRPDAVT
jgi:drug/metabolite transporter (DMT)-like permease